MINLWGGGEDFIIAFFPCVRFEQQILLYFRGDHYGSNKWELSKKLNYDLKIHKELARNYELITKLVLVCLKRKIPLIIENPYSEQHYLTKYWALKPKIIDKNRRDNGDYYIKPTQYFFVNCEPKSNFIMEAMDMVEYKDVDSQNTVERSMIHPQYANRFIRQYIIEGD